MELTKALRAGDLEKVHFYAHSLKGIASLVVCGSLERRASVIDRLAKERNLQGAKRELAELEGIIGKTTKSLKEFASFDGLIDKE